MDNQIPGPRARKGLPVFALGVVGGMLVAGLLVPLAYGERLGSSSSAPAPVEAAAATDIDNQAPSTGLEPAQTPGAGAVPAAGGAAAGGSGRATTGGGLPGRPSAGAVGGGVAPGPGVPTGERGVFSNRIKVGFLILDIATVGRLGGNVAIDPEQQQAAMQAYVDDINSRGGINGRAIEPVYRTYDVVSDSDQRAACLYLTEDAKVFAVIIGFNLVNPLLCLVEEHQTPLFNNVSNNPDWIFARAGGRLYTSFARSGRMMAVFAAELDQMAMLDGKRIGILSDDQVDPRGEVAKQLSDSVTEMGGQVVRRGQLSGDLQTSASQVPVEVNQMQAERAELILLVTGNTVRGTQFVQQAETQGYRPKYAVNDWGSNFTDSGSANMPQSFDGAVLITATRNNEFRANRPEPAKAAECRRIYESRSKRTLQPRGTNENGLTMNICDLVRWFEASAKATGSNLTRPRLSAAVQGLGPLSTASWGDGSFAPGKFDMNDYIRTCRWSFATRNFQPVDDFRRGRF